MAADQQELHQAVLHGQDFSKHQANLILNLGVNFQRYIEQQIEPSRIQVSQGGNTESDTEFPGAKAKTPTSLAIEAPALVTTSATPKGHNTEPENLEPESLNPSKPNHSYFREHLLKNLKTLLDRLRYDMQEVVHTTLRASHIMIDTQVRNHLLLWTEGTKPDRLWIQGPSGTSRPSQNQLTAVCLTALSRQNKIPCISYFCCPNQGRTMFKAFHSDALKEMLGSIVTQPTLLLPERFTSSLDLSPTRYAILKSENPRIESFLELLRDLRTLGPKHLHCILDGVQILENRSEPQHTRDLLSLMHTLCTLDEKRAPLAANDICESDSLTTCDNHNCNVIKVCFTTDGYMDGLAQVATLHLIKKVEYECEAYESFAEGTAQLFTFSES